MADTESRLDTLVAEICDLRSAAALLSWDERVCMPPGGVPAHGHMLATLRRMAHEQFTSDEVGRLIERAKADSAGQPQSRLARHATVLERDYGKATRVPGAHVAEQARASSEAHQAWRQARQEGRFSIFEPHLARLLDLKREYVGFFNPLAHPYDALLDDFEPGAQTSAIRAMFNELRTRQVELLRAIATRPPIDHSCLSGGYDEQDLTRFALDVVSEFGFDWTRGRQDKSAHPFATSIGADDVRITTRFDQRHPFETLFSLLHETGHALYEQGISPEWNRTAVRGGISLGIHESQSRLWENIIGRSRPFWERFFPRLQQRIPAPLAGVTLDGFYRAVNRVQPSLIRVEADEVTYNLHVMLRVEMEIAMLNGDFPLCEAPQVWNDKMGEYLGVTPDGDANGILQDMHWSIGLFGYFATYTIGNLVSVQFWNAFRRSQPDCDEQIRRGEFAPLRGWLRDQIHHHGRSLLPAEIVERVTGGSMQAGPYLDYLETKYRNL